MKYGYDDVSVEDVYYKILLTNYNKLAVVCLQDFDECDYNSDKFIKDDNDSHRTFYTKHDAREWLNENIKREHIDDEDKYATDLDDMYK